MDTRLTFRTCIVKLETGDINHVRGLPAEYGQIMPLSTERFFAVVGEWINVLEGDADQSVINELRIIVAFAIGVRESRRFRRTSQPLRRKPSTHPIS